MGRLTQANYLEKQYIEIKSDGFHLKSVYKNLKKIYGWEDEELKNGALDFLDKVFGNIVRNPQNMKFRNMNITKIRKLTKKWKSLPLLIFFSAGFVEDMSGGTKRMDLPLSSQNEFEECYYLIQNCRKFDPTLDPVIEPPAEVVSDPVVLPEAETDAVMTEETETKPCATETNDDNAMDVDPPQENDDTMATEATEDQPKAQKVDWEALAAEEAEVDDLLARIKAEKAAKGIETLNMSELQGKSKEEKIAILEEKRAKFRAAKMKNELNEAKEKAEKQRKAVKGAAQLAREREEYQNKMAIEAKKREKAMNKKRRAAAREKIRKQKEQRRLEREAKERLKAQQQQGGS